jgi:hypothetical protein
VKILKSSATSEKNIENAQVSIKGYYLTPQSEQRVKFKIQKQIIVEQTETPTPSAFGLVTIQMDRFRNNARYYRFYNSMVRKSLGRLPGIFPAVTLNTYD